MMSARRERAWQEVDGMAPEWRACVHEYGYPIVHAAREAGVSTPNRLHNLIREIWTGARSDRDRRGATGTVDWLLMQSGSSLSAAALGRALLADQLVILPRTPTRAMIDASLAAVSGYNVKCSKFEKHQRRLIAAIAAEPDYVARITTRPLSEGR